MLKTKFTMADRGEYTIFEPDLPSLSAAWTEFRDKAGIGDTDIIAGGAVTDDAGEVVGHMSFNGKVWSGETWKPGDAPVFDPFG